MEFNAVYCMMKEFGKENSKPNSKIASDSFRNSGSVDSSLKTLCQIIKCKQAYWLRKTGVNIQKSVYWVSSINIEPE